MVQPVLGLLTFFCGFCLVVVVGFFVCAFFWGVVVGLFLVLGCGLGFVWLLLWLWERFFNMRYNFSNVLLENTIIQGRLCFCIR